MNLFRLEDHPRIVGKYGYEVYNIGARPIVLGQLSRLNFCTFITTEEEVYTTSLIILRRERQFEIPGIGDLRQCRSSINAF